MNATSRKWYISLIAAYYLVICFLTCIYYVSLHFQAGAASVPWTNQLLCLAAAVSGAAYFFKPALGHRGLIGVTVLTLFAIGESNLPATRFHVMVLAILLLPLLWRRSSQSQAAPL